MCGPRPLDASSGKAGLEWLWLDFDSHDQKIRSSSSPFSTTPFPISFSHNLSSLYKDGLDICDSGMECSEGPRYFPRLFQAERTYFW